MVLKYFKHFEKDSVADAGLHEDSWTTDEDLKIKRIFLARKDGVSYTKTTFYLKIAGKVYTDPVIPAITLGPDKLTSPDLDIAVAKGEKLMFTLKNLEGATISSMVTIEAHEP